MIWLHHTISGILLYNTNKTLWKWNLINLAPFLSSFYILWSIFPDFDFIFRLFNLDYIWHKTLTHSILFFFCLIYIIYNYINKKYLIYIKAFSIGYIVHLLLDIIVWWKIYLYWLWENMNKWIQFTQLSNWYNGSLWYIFSILLLLLLLKVSTFHRNINNKLYTFLLILLSIIWDALFVFKIL